MNKCAILFFFGILNINFFYAQDDLMALLDEVAEEPESSTKVFATFKAIKIVNAHTTETVKRNTLDFRITHRFGNMGSESGGGIHSFYGFDSAENIRFSFDYGITDRLMIGIGRSKVKEHLDASLKYRLLEQTTHNKMPISVAYYQNVAFTPMLDLNDNWDKILHRISYASQLIIARKFTSSLSMELLPTYIHRNYVQNDINEYNNANETNDLFALGIGGRVKLTKRFAIVADYFYTFSEYRMSNEALPYYMPLSIGIEIETGGHVFHINLSNSAGIIENDFISNSPDSWLMGGFKLGFNISRVFSF